MAAGGAVFLYSTAQIKTHRRSLLPTDRDDKFVQKEHGRECFSKCSFGGSRNGIAGLCWQAGNNSKHRWSGEKAQALLAGDLSSLLFSAGSSSSIPMTREGCLSVRGSGHTNKSLAKKPVSQVRSRYTIPWTAWGTVEGFGKKEKERRIIVHPVNVLRKQRSVLRPDYLGNCSRLGAYQRSRVSIILPEKRFVRPIRIQAKKESCPEWSRYTVGKVQNVSESSSGDQVFEVPTGAVSSARLTTAQATEHSVKSRAWTAWKQVLTSSSFFRDPRIPGTTEAERAIQHDQNSCTFTWHCRPPPSAQTELRVSNLESQELSSSKKHANARTINQDKDCPRLSQREEKQDLMVNRLQGQLSPRDLAVGAIFQALTPNLDQKKNGQGELALRMADFVYALKASAQTNEIKHCEQQVQACLAAMTDGADLAKLDFDIFQLWLDVTEMQLMTAPREADVLELLTFIEDLENQFHDPQHMHSASLTGGAAQHSMTRDPHADSSGADKSQRLDTILQAAQRLEQMLANMPSSAEITANMTLKRVHAQEGLRRQEATTTAAVRQYRDALGKGEVAWFRNLDEISSRLESVAGVVIPMEMAFDSQEC